MDFITEAFQTRPGLRCMLQNCEREGRLQQICGCAPSNLAAGASMYYLAGETSTARSCSVFGCLCHFSSSCPLLLCTSCLNCWMEKVTKRGSHMWWGLKELDSGRFVAF